MIKKDTCTYHKGVENLSTHTRLTDSIWDIEDIVTLGKKSKGCPYYTSRLLAKSADIIFCPYNYITDPLIRSAVDFDLKDAIIIFDEAHNLESCCTDSASLDVSSITLNDLTVELNTLLANEWEDGLLRACNREFDCLLGLTKGLFDWCERSPGQFTVVEYERSLKLWKDNAIITQLGSVGIDKEGVVSMIKALNEVVECSKKLDRIKSGSGISNVLITYTNYLF